MFVCFRRTCTKRHQLFLLETRRMTATRTSSPCGKFVGVHSTVVQQATHKQKFTDVPVPSALTIMRSSFGFVLLFK